MKARALTGPLRMEDDSMSQTTVEKVTGRTSSTVLDSLAIEEPLEIQLNYGPPDSRVTRSISVTMRTPGNDFDLAAGFLMTEGVIRDANDIEQITYAGDPFNEGTQSPQAMDVHKLGSKQNTVRVDLAAEVEVNLGSLQRNFYTTSSCGICGEVNSLRQFSGRGRVALVKYMVAKHEDPLPHMLELGDVSLDTFNYDRPRHAIKILLVAFAMRVWVIPIEARRSIRRDVDNVLQ